MSSCEEQCLSRGQRSPPVLQNKVVLSDWYLTSADSCPLLCAPMWTVNLPIKSMTYTCKYVCVYAEILVLVVWNSVPARRDVTFSSESQLGSNTISVVGCGGTVPPSRDLICSIPAQMFLPLTTYCSRQGLSLPWIAEHEAEASTGPEAWSSLVFGSVQEDKGTDPGCALTSGLDIGSSQFRLMA